MLNRNMIILVLCQLVSVSGTVLTITIGGIAGTALASRPEFATLPMSIMVVGTALATIPAAMLMQKVGRRYGFMAGLLTAAVAMLCAGAALEAERFVLFCLSTGLLGASIAFSQQYRFAAAESVPAAKVSQAVSVVLIGSIGGAFVGPELAKATVPGDNPYQRSLLVAGALYLGAMVLMFFLRSTAAAPAATPGSDDEARPARVVFSQGIFIVAVLGGVVGQGVMTLIMTASPLAMHIVDGFSLADTADVIRNHVLAMYLPALFSGVLIARFGIARIMYIGLVVMVITIVVGLAGRHYLHYSSAMIALGVGWNFLFVGGTTLLVHTHRHSERFKAQAFNDFSVFGGSALASLGAGTILHVAGWNGVLYVASPALVLLFAALVALRRDPRLARTPA